MKKKRNYIHQINKKIDNNQKYCNISLDNEINNDENIIINNNENNTLSVEDKLRKIFNTNGYVFNIDVKIITENKTYYSKIAGRVGNNLITLDNDVINIKDIKDIIF